MFKDLMEKVKAARIEDIKIHSERILEKELKRKQEDADRHLKMVAGYSNADYRTNNCSDELVDIINGYGFEIKSYKKEDLKDNSGQRFSLLETYYCAYRNWSFDIKNKYEPYYGENKFSVSSVKNHRTDEHVDFSCYINGVDGEEETMSKFLVLLEYDDEESFIKDYYARYIQVPGLLKENGINCIIVKSEYRIAGIDCLIKIDEKIYLKFYTSHDKKTYVFITSDKYWNIHTMGFLTAMLQREIGYEFNYKSESDIGELIKCIESFSDHLNNKIGYIENDRYYSNKDIKNYFETLQDNYLAYDKWKYGYVTISYKEEFQHIKDDGSSLGTINKYKGVEVKFKVLLRFNQGGEYSIGDIKNISDITIVYDKNIDNNNCLLTIESELYKECEDTLYEENYEFKDTFTGVMKILDNYIKGLCEVYDVPV